jgi:hypothetical protein
MMVNADISTPEQRKQLIEFYKAMKMASRMFPKKGPGSKYNSVIQMADQIIEELKKDNPDENKISMLTEKIRNINL